MDALILAGGENKRIPVPKGFLKINSKSIIESNIELLKGICDRVVVSTNAPELYFSLDVLLIGDVVEQRGPMTGIFSTLINPDLSSVFVTACDMPFINVILIKYMIDRWENRWDALIPIFERNPQPLFGVYSKEIVTKMEKNIRSGKKKLRNFLREIKVLYVSEEEVRKIDREGRSFVNINTMEDFQREGGTICLV